MKQKRPTVSKVNYEKFVPYLLSAVVLLLFSNTLGGGFLNWDDTLYISDNPLIFKPLNFDSFKALYDFDRGISVVLFSFLIQNNIIGFDPYWLHMVNVIIHVFNVLLVYYICKSLLKNWELSFVIALLFAAFPLRSETVGWIIQRKDLLYTFFYLLALLSYLKYQNRNNFIYIIILIGAAFIAQFCKAQALSLPFILLLFEYFLKKKLDYKSFVLFYAVLSVQHFYKIFYVWDSTIYTVLLISISYFMPLYVVFGNTENKNRISDKVLHFFGGLKSNSYLITTYISLILLIFNYFIYYNSGKILVYFIAFVIFYSSLYYFKNKRGLEIFKRNLITKLSNYVFVILYVIVLFFLATRNTVIRPDDALLSLLLTHICFYRIFNLRAGLKTINRIIEAPINILLSSFIIIILFKDYFFYSNDVMYDFLIEIAVLFLVPLLIINSNLLHNYILRYKKVFISVVGVFILFIFAVIALKASALWEGSDIIIPLKNRIFMAFYSLNYYVLRFVFPFHLNAMHPYPEGIYSSLPLIYKISGLITLVIAIITTYLVIKIKDKEVKHQALFGIMFFILNIGLVLHIIPILGIVVVADRYTYLAYFGLFWTAVVYFNYKIKYIKSRQSKTWIQLIFLLLFIAYSTQTYTRNHVWKDDISFWGDVIAKSPDNHYAYFSKALKHFEKKEYKKSLNLYNKAIELHDKDSKYFTNRGATYKELKEFDKALKDLTKALELNPENAMAYNNRGNLYYDAGNYKEALADFEKAVEISKDEDVFKNNYEKALKVFTYFEDLKNEIPAKYDKERSQFFNESGLKKAMRGEFIPAIEDFSIAITYDSTNVNVLINRANSYASINKLSDALKDLNAAVMLTPTDGNIYFNIGHIKQQLGMGGACEDWAMALNLGVKQAEEMLARFCR